MEIKLLSGVVPKQRTNGSAGFDLHCIKDVLIYPNDSIVLKTGIAVWIEDSSLAGFILPRSGLGSQGLVLANTVGLIDSDYQGELLVNAWNRGGRLINLRAGDRFAQLVFLPIFTPQFTIVNEFSSSTDRNSGNFGSTGVV